MRKVLETILNRMVIVILLVAVQFVFIMVEIFKLSNYYMLISILFRCISFLVVFWIVCQEDIRPEVKIAWIVPILLFPLFGGLMYLLYGNSYVPRKIRLKLDETVNTTSLLLKQNEEDKTVFDESNRNAGEMKYLCNIGYPIYKDAHMVYYESGEKYWEDLLVELDKADKFIFLEYFIIDEGEMWNSIYKILKRKVQEGVEVRLLYDDIGSVFHLPADFAARLEKEGLHCLAFNRLFPLMSVIQNNRDHRKIAVIDGKAAFTGGINLADEYINHTHPHGHWKDTGIKVCGEAVWSFTVMFLQMWSISGRTDEDYTVYHTESRLSFSDNGWIQPFGDIPYLNERIGEKVYLTIINNAQKYLYIYTPYLIIGNDMIRSLIRAAERGVDVRIVTPGIPDKKSVYWLTQSYYKVLVEGNVKILQYTPGFIHAKCILSDDYKAVIGTINFDYRSFMHHFECGAVIYGAGICKDIKEDMIRTFGKCEVITKEWFAKKHIRWRIFGPVLKLLSPLF